LHYANIPARLNNVTFTLPTPFVDAAGGDLQLRSTGTAAIDTGVTVGGGHH
jgi:hypothetical protein